MACRISELVLGCRDPEVLARFWCEVLDFVVLDREEGGSLEIGPREGFGGPQPTLRVTRGRPEREILAVAAELSADLIVLGVTGQNDFHGRLFGSTTNSILRAAPCPVLTARA